MQDSTENKKVDAKPEGGFIIQFGKFKLEISNISQWNIFWCCTMLAIILFSYLFGGDMAEVINQFVLK